MMRSNDVIVCPLCKHVRECVCVCVCVSVHVLGGCILDPVICHFVLALLCMGRVSNATSSAWLEPNWTCSLFTEPADKMETWPESSELHPLTCYATKMYLRTAENTQVNVITAIMAIYEAFFRRLLMMSSCVFFPPSRAKPLDE